MAICSTEGDHKVLVDGDDTTPDYLAPKLTGSGGITLTVLNPGGDEQLDIDGGSVAGDHKSLVNGADTTPNYLEQKVVAGANMAVTVVDLGGGDLALSLAAVVPPGSSDHKVIVDLADTTPNYLGSKIVAGSNVTLTVLNPAGNEQIQIDVAGAPPTGAAGGDLGGTYPNPTVIAVEETGGPTRLTIGAIADTQVLTRSGTTVIGTAPSSLGITWANVLASGNLSGGTNPTITSGDSILGQTGVGVGGAVPIVGAAGAATFAGGATSLTGGAGGTSGAGGASSVAGGIGGTTGIGGSASLTGGAGGSVSGNGGAAAVVGGTATDGAGGAASLTGGAGVGTNRAGGQVNITGGSPSGSGTPGSVVIAGASGVGSVGAVASMTGGAGAATFNGGGANLTGGAGSTSGSGGQARVLGGVAGATGTGGAAALQGGAGGATSGTGGTVFVTGGPASTDGNGGGVSVQGGAGAGTSRAGGAVAIKGGTSTDGIAGAAVNITGGTPGVTGVGGSVSLAGGAGGTTSGAGGAATVQGGDGKDGDGGNANVFAGDGVTTTAANRNGGSVIVRPGISTGTGLAGSILLRDDQGTTMLEVARLGGARSFVSLCFGATLTSTNLPANGGSGVIFIANCTTAPTTGFPVGGYTMYADSTGLYVLSPSGALTQLAPP